MRSKLKLKPVVVVDYLNAHDEQRKFIESTKRLKIVRAGRRGGKTVGAAIADVKAFVRGDRVLYGAPTLEQVGRYWTEVKRMLKPLVDTGLYRINEIEHYIEKIADTENRIKAKTCWNANTLRGDYAKRLTLDEWQLMAEDTWSEVGAPMLLDKGGTATFIYTPPSLFSSGISRARDPRHASKMFKAAQADTTGTWGAFHFTSHDNPHLDKQALGDITKDMTKDAYRREIMAEDDEIESSWLVYGTFNEGLCAVPRFTIPTTWPIYSGHDFGPANPGALFLARVRLPLPPGAPPHMRYNDIVAWREYHPGGGVSVAQHTDNFKATVKDYVTVDQPLIVRSSGGNRFGEDEIRQGYGAHGWPIQPPRRKEVPVQIGRVIALMELNKLFIFKDLYHLLAQIDNCMWKLDDENKPTNVVMNEAKYHMLACLRYAGSDFDQETAATGDVVVSTRRDTQSAIRFTEQRMM